MQICIPTTDDSGLDAQCSDHFGRAPYYTLVETTDNSVDVVENQSDHFGGAKQPPEFVADQGVAAVIVEELGQRSMDVFTDRGIDVYQSSAGTVGDLVSAFERDELSELGPEDVHPSGHHSAE